MYGLAAEVFWFFADPARLIPGLVIFGAVLLWTPWRGVGRGLVTVGAAALFAVATLPLGRWVAGPLEYRFPQFEAAAAAPVDGIVVLGAGAAVTSKLTALPVIEASGARLVKMMELARLYPEARLIFTGGGRPSVNDPRTEAEIAAADLASLNFDVSRLLLEARSLNTYDNAVLSKALANPQPGERWLLITSAAHMPRAVGAFRAAGWQVTPVPVEYLFPPNTPFSLTFEPVRRFIALSRIAHEWVGLVVYRVLGRSNEFLPDP